jgi:hypothetical protein
MSPAQTEAPEPLEPAPPDVVDLAEACVRFVSEALNLKLDYTPETLPVLDHYLRERGHGAKAEVAALIVPAAGAYFGEVVRRTLPGARWYCPAGDHRSWRLEFAPFFLTFNPIGVASEALTQADSEDWHAHFQVLDEARDAVAHALASAAEMQPQDYYSFSMRLEALQQIADLLGALETAQPTPRHFGPEVYRASRGGLLAAQRPS